MAQSFQTPQVHITYDVDTGGTTEKRELPFIVGILADLAGDVAPGQTLPELHARKMLDIDRDSFNDVMRAMAPRVDLAPLLHETTLADLKNSGTPQDLEIIFSTLDDFNPLSVVRALPGLNAKYQTRCQLRRLQDQAPAGDTIDAQVDLIDQQLSAALSCIMHSASFKAVEQTWRGLARLVFNTETGDMLKLRVFHASKDELREDMQKTLEFDQSALFKIICEAAYGTVGGFPYSLLVGDYDISASTDDVAFLRKISEVAASGHAPFIAAASPALFGLAGFHQLGKPRELNKIFNLMDLEGWREFRAMEDARYVALVLPRALLRLPYGNAGPDNRIRCEGLNFEEQLADPVAGSDNFLWGNAAYLLAERITSAVSCYGWPAAICGAEGGGLVQGLPWTTCTTDGRTSKDAAALSGSTQVVITDSREKELSDQGFIALRDGAERGTATFCGGQTTSAPQQYFSDEATANARMAATLPYLLAASRFAQYIKVIMRNKIGNFLTRANVESYLNTWIANYVLLDDNATPAAKAAYPLRAASVVVTDAPGQPGEYQATLFLQPHFQLEQLTTSIRLVVNLPS